MKSPDSVCRFSFEKILEKREVLNMSSVKDVRQQLAKMQREMEAKELELYRAQAQPLLDSFVDFLLNDKEICKKLKDYNIEEIRLIAAQFGKDFDRIVSECNTDIEVARQKRAERAAKKKERAAVASKEKPVQIPVTEAPKEWTYVDDEGWTVHMVRDENGQESIKEWTRVDEDTGRMLHKTKQENGDDLIWRERPQAGSYGY